MQAAQNSSLSVNLCGPALEATRIAFVKVYPAIETSVGCLALQLENFMCHENFYLELGPHCTFINGTNGSGKSAILQGLQFCLGMQAAQTGRARAPRFAASSIPCTACS